MEDKINPQGLENQELPNNTENQNVKFDAATFEAGLLKDEAKLSLLQEEYSTVEDKLHNEFENLLEQNPQNLFNEEELEILASDSNIASKNRMLRNRFEKYRDEKLSLKKDEISKFEEQLNGRKKEFDIASSWTKFAKDNPTVNMDEFGEFIQEDLTTRQKTKLIEESKTKYDFLVGALDIYKQTQGKGENKDDELPPDLSELNGVSGNSSFSDDKAREKYLKSIGVGRE